MTSLVTHSEPLFVGNHPALDFLNTAPMEDGIPANRLVTYGDLVAWLEQAGLLTPEDARRAQALGSTSAGGREALAQAIALRELLRGIVERLAAGAEPSAAAIGRLNATLRTESGACSQVRRTENGFERVTRVRLDSPADVLAVLHRAVAALFTELDLTLVRKCEDASCVLFFHDTTKNHKRRWCRMETCGNRNKVQAYRARVTGAG